MNALTDKAVVVTGAGRGLGREYAKYVSTHGANVIVNDIDADPAHEVAVEICAAGGVAIPHVADISEPEFAGGLIDRCVAEFGTIDGLVTNAGDFTTGSLWKQDLNHLKRMFEVNTLGVFYCASHAAAVMRSRRSGSIVNVCSAMMAGYNDLSGYAGTKGAVASFTYSWAAELLESEVRVNAIVPAARTGMAASFVDSLGLGEQEREAAIAQQPDPELVTPIVGYLLSDLSSGVTGQILYFIESTLGIISHPILAGATHYSPEWTITGLAEAISHDIGKRQMPLGFAAGDISNLRSRDQ